jgi:hypothetical protein
MRGPLTRRGAWHVQPGAHSRPGAKPVVRRQTEAADEARGTLGASSRRGPRLAAPPAPKLRGYGRQSAQEPDNRVLAMKAS